MQNSVERVLISAANTKLVQKLPEKVPVKVAPVLDESEKHEVVNSFKSNMINSTTSRFKLK